MKPIKRFKNLLGNTKSEEKGLPISDVDTSHFQVFIPTSNGNIYLGWYTCMYNDFNGEDEDAVLCIQEKNGMVINAVSILTNGVMKTYGFVYEDENVPFELLVNWVLNDPRVEFADCVLWEVSDKEEDRINEKYKPLEGHDYGDGILVFDGTEGARSYVDKEFQGGEINPKDKKFLEHYFNIIINVE